MGDWTYRLTKAWPFMIINPDHSPCISWARAVRTWSVTTRCPHFCPAFTSGPTGKKQMCPSPTAKDAGSPISPPPAASLRGAPAVFPLSHCKPSCSGSSGSAPGKQPALPWPGVFVHSTNGWGGQGERPTSDGPGLHPLWFLGSVPPSSAKGTQTVVFHPNVLVSGCHWRNGGWLSICFCFGPWVWGAYLGCWLVLGTHL